MPLPRNWLEHVNQPLTDSELTAIRKAVNRGQPLGSHWGATNGLNKQQQNWGLSRLFDAEADRQNTG